MWWAKKPEVEPSEPLTFVCDDCGHVISNKQRYSILHMSFRIDGPYYMHYCKTCKPPYDTVVPGYPGLSYSRYYKEIEVDVSGNPLPYNSHA